MTRPMQREVDKLKKGLLRLGALVEENLGKAVLSVARRDGAMAEEVIRGDFRVDEMEVDLEEEGLKLLALYQPVAIDLRFIVACLRINSDLERIGDLAVNIAERSRYLASRDPLEIPFDLEGMAKKAETMLRMSLDALVNLNGDLAQTVRLADDEVDAINREAYKRIYQAIRRASDRTEDLIHLLSVSRHLERVADHATNISEDVIYLLTGEIVRHKEEDFLAQAKRERDGGPNSPPPGRPR